MADACSVVYASPLVLEQFAKSSKRKYNPFKEDVFSLGLTLLQLALVCDSQQVKELRQSAHRVKEVIGNEVVYSDNIKCLLLIMLKWESVERPDFVQLEQILKDVFRMEDCKQLLSKLLSQQSENRVYKDLYQSVEQFLYLKKVEVQEQQNITP